MKSRRIGYAAWLLLAVCLYFFENNTGTRVVLLCSLLFPLVPLLRRAFFSADESGKEILSEPLTEKTFHVREAEEPGDVRPYLPGDPVKRIHWKLSAKKDELLVRETAAEPEEAEEERTSRSFAEERKRKNPKHIVLICAAGILTCIVLLLAIPEANRGMQALCNRVFAASEAVNTYVYEYYPVPDGQNIFPAALLLLGILGFLSALIILLRSCLPAFLAAAAVMLFQAYFGLAFPAWIHIPLCGLAALRMMRTPCSRKTRIIFCAAVLLVSVLTALALPGTDPGTEAASEKVRDYLNQAFETVTGTIQEVPEGETETRRIHTRSVKSGDREAETEKEFQLVTVEEEQISMPHWVNWLKVILLFVLSAALVTLPFVPFLLLNARKRKAQEVRKTFLSDPVGEAVQAVFRRIIAWLEAAGFGAGNLLYRNWAVRLPDSLPEGYADRFARCAEDFEEAVYSRHDMPEEKRQNALALLAETETALWNGASRKQRFLLKYWMCLYE